MICTQIRYHPHQVLCDTILGLYRELNDLQSSGPDDPLRLVRSATLKQVLGLFDEVINSNYSLQDESIPIIDLALPAPPCSFCGGELFGAVFYCNNSCLRDDAPRDSADRNILICSLCFIDGRACRCGSMTPYRIQPLDGLIELRKNIFDLLHPPDENGRTSP